jgi:amino acid transporter
MKEKTYYRNWIIGIIFTLYVTIFWIVPLFHDNYWISIIAIHSLVAFVVVIVFTLIYLMIRYEDAKVAEKIEEE